MQVGVIDSAVYNGTNVKTLTFPNYKNSGFTGKWANMIDAVVMSVEELPPSSKEHYIVIKDSSLWMGVRTWT